MLIGAFILLLTGWGCYQYAKPVFGAWAGGWLLLVKVMAGFVAMVYYLLIVREGDLWFYNSQAIAYVNFIDAGFPLLDFLQQKADPSAHATPQGRTFFFLKVLTIIYWLIGNNIWLAGMLFSCVSFLSVVYLVKRLSLVGIEIPLEAIVIFFIWPSIAIWGSGLSKETLMLASMNVMAGAAFPLMNGKVNNWLWHGFLLFLATVFLAKLRMYVLLSLMPFLLGAFVIKLARQYLAHRWSQIVIALVGVISVVGIVMAFSYSDTSLNPRYVFKAFADNHAAIVASSSPQHVVMGLETLWAWPQVIFQFLLAVLAGMLGPFPWEVNSFWEALLMLEALVLACLFVSNTSLKQRLPGFVWMPMIAYALFSAGMITLATPNYGSLSRYRLSFYIVFIFLACFQHPLLTKITWMNPTKESSDV